MQMIPKFKIKLLYLLFILSLVIIFFRPINYYYHNLINDKCSIIGDVCINMSTGWFRDYYSDIIGALIEDNSQVIFVSYLDGLSISKQLHIGLVDENVLNEERLDEYSTERIDHKLGKLYILNNTIFNSDLNKVRIYLSEYNLYIATDSISALDEIQSISKVK